MSKEIKTKATLEEYTLAEIKAYEKTIEGLNRDLSNRNEKIASLSEQHKNAADDAKEQIKTLKESQKDYDQLSANFDKSLDEVAELSAQLGAHQKADGASVVTIAKKQYRLKGKNFSVPGYGKLTADELATNKEALAYLLKVKSEVLVGIEA